MAIVVTGASGFLGARLADALLAADGSLRPARLVLADVIAPPARADPRVRCEALDLTAPEAAARLVAPDTAVVFHLAAVVSGQAEEDLDLGMRVNLDATRALLDAVRHRAPSARFVFASTVGVFGGVDRVEDSTAREPQSSYGTAKAMCELMLTDYARRGLVDARAVRLPTVTVRAGSANRAVTSFASAIVREPLAGRVCVVPVDAQQALWVCSPRAAVANLQHAAALDGAALGARRAVSLPGLRVSAGEMAAALRAVAGAGAAARLRWVRDAEAARMVASFPSEFDTSRAMALGFMVDATFEDIIRAYIEDELHGEFVP